MNTEQAKTVLTQGNLQIAAQVLQAIDVLAEKEFLENHTGLPKENKFSEADMASHAKEYTGNFPAFAITLNGYGYHILSSCCSNLLLALGMKVESEWLIEGRLRPSE